MYASVTIFADSFIVSTSFGGDTEDGICFAVMDGHGDFGHECSRYAKDHLEECFKRSRGSNDFDDAFTMAHIMLNAELRGDVSIDDYLSGTTLTSVAS